MKRLLFVSLCVFFIACASGTRRDVPFDYSQVLTREYRFGTGKTIPLTFERSNNVSGTITADGKYFVYASNRERGNFDIYLRALNDIKTARITTHPARDFAPEISPDGKWCVFVSTRDDPEGDIFIMKLHPETMLEGDMEGESKNLSVLKDPKTNAVMPVRDTWPTFSPDAQYIAFSSTRDGDEAIYMMDKDGKNVRKIAEGTQPRFSHDGSMIVFVRYAAGKSNVYTIHIATGQLSKITETNFVELSPCFGKTSADIYFMRIQQDTNKDGVIDANDSGVLVYCNTQTNEEYQLTLSEDSSVTPRWVPYAGGVIVYSIVEGEHINIAMIPETGIIPKQKNAKGQYELALRYKEDFDDEERYARCLFATYYFFKDENDSDTQMIIARALYELSRIKEFQHVTTLLSKEAKKSKPAEIYVKYLGIRDSDKLPYLENTVKELSKQNNEKLIPFFMEELGDRYAVANAKGKALNIYDEILKRYPNYARVMYVRYKAGTLRYQAFYVPDEWIAVLQSSYTYLKNAITMAVVQDATAVVPQEKYKKAQEAIAATNVPLLKAIYQYVAAQSLIERAQYKEATQFLKQALENAKRLDVVYYLANVKLGELSLTQKNDDWVMYFEAAVNNYQAQWKQDITPLIEKLIEYFEQTGQKLFAEGKYKDAAALYKRYVTMNTLLHLKRRYKDIYSVYAPGAHRGYIDASVVFLADDVTAAIEKEYLDRLAIARMDFDKAHIYGLGYIFVKEAQMIASSPHVMEGRTNQDYETVLDLLKRAVRQIDWSLFIDDMFVDAYLLKGWIYQYVDELRTLFPSKKRLIDAYFPEYLWEKTIPLYEKALTANNEQLTPQREADIYANMANVYFLLKNYSLAAKNYAQALHYKKVFSSLTEEALFYYHYGYCQWQQGKYSDAYTSMHNAYRIYKAIAQKNEATVADKLIRMYKYFALFERMQGNFHKALQWYKTAYTYCIRYEHSDEIPRLLIEIAECYRKLDDDEQALTYLELAKRSLPKAASVHYKIGWKIAGFGPLYFYDLGQDQVVIGEGKIVSRLSALEMDILINNMEAQIYTKRGIFRSAIGSYAAIIEKTQKAKSSLLRNAHFTALNNMGYCYVQSGDMQKALEWYDTALHVAQRMEMPIDSIYPTIVQWTYCHVAGSSNSSISEIDAAIASVDRYEKDLYQKVFNALVDSYNEKMKAQKKKPLDEDIALLSQQAHRQVEVYTVKLNALKGVLLMHKASLIEKMMLQQKENVLVPSNEILQLYTNASEHFSKAIALFGNQATEQEFVIKMRINRGICRIYCGQAKEGYDDIVSARFKANAIQSKELVWIAEAVLWDMAHRFTQMQQLIENPDRLMQNVLSRVELLPPLYAMNKDYICTLLDRYTDTLLAKKRFQEAYEFQQRKQVLLAAFNALSIQTFHNTQDNTLYANFKKTCFTIKELEEKRTLAILNEDPDSAQKISDLIITEYSKIDEYRKRASSFMLPLLGVYRPAHPQGTVIHFYEFDTTLYAWIVQHNKIEWRRIAESLQTDSLTEAIKRILPASGSPTFVIINDTFLAISKNIPNSVLYRIGCIPFTSRVLHAESMWLPASAIATDTTLSNVSGITDDINDAEYIVDSKGTLLHITPQYCFGNKLERSVIFKKADKIKDTELMIFADAALYSDIASIVMYIGKDSETIVKACINDTPDILDAIQSHILILGRPASSITERRENVATITQRTKNGFTTALVRGDYQLALGALQKWRRAGLDSKEYFKNLFIVLLYQGKIDEAISKVNIQGYSDYSVQSFNVYAYIQKGEIDSAEKLLSQMQWKDTYDYGVYTAIVKAFKYQERLQDFRKISHSNVSLIPFNQLLLLYAQVAYIVGEHEKAREAITHYTIDYIPSQRELMLAYILGNISGGDPYSRARLSVENAKKSNYTVTIVQLDEQYNDVTHYLVYEVLRNKVILSEDEWQYILLVTEKSTDSLWLDEQFIIKQTTELLLTIDPQRAVQYVKTWKYDDKGKSAYIYTLCAISSFVKNNEFLQAYELCKVLKRLPYRLEQVWYSYYIYSAIMTGKTNEAETLLQKSRMPEWDNVLHSLFSMNIQMQKIVKAKVVDSSKLQSLASAIDEYMKSLDSKAIQHYYSEYKYLLDKIVDYQISYAMSRGNQWEALRYAEIHKMIEGIAVFNDNSRFKSMYDSLVNNMFPLREIQKKIPRQMGIAYITKNENDLFIWIITRTYIQPLRIQNVYSNLNEAVSEFYTRVGLLQQAFDTEARIADIMQPFAKECGNFSTILIITDVYTESIPFEIIQFNKNEPLLVFLPSLMTAMDETKPVSKQVWVNVVNAGTDIITAAMRHSGMVYSLHPIKDGIVIIDQPIVYSKAKRELQVTSTLLQPDYYIINLAKSDAYYMNLFLIQKEAANCIVFNNVVRDVNSVIFIREYFASLNDKTVADSYKDAVQYLKNDKRFKYPAYWLGIRLYSSSMNSFTNGVK